jgi:hypothetical protein
MKVFNLDRGEGKTTALIKIMLEPGNEDVIYVAPTHAQANYAFTLAQRLAGADTLNVPGRARFIAARQMDLHSGRRYVVDEADAVVPFVAIALTDEDKKAAWHAARMNGDAS